MRAWLKRFRIRCHIRRAARYLGLSKRHQDAANRLRGRIAP